MIKRIVLKSFSFQSFQAIIKATVIPAEAVQSLQGLPEHCPVPAHADNFMAQVRSPTISIETLRVEPAPGVAIRIHVGLDERGKAACSPQLDASVGKPSLAASDRLVRPVSRTDDWPKP
jgi:hypothetical protein